jgi:hypothetical protein
MCVILGSTLPADRRGEERRKDSAHVASAPHEEIVLLKVIVC